MNHHKSITFLLFLTFTAPAADAQDALLHRVRKQDPSPTPRRFNAIPDRIADILLERHHHHPTLWGLSRSTPDLKLPYDEVVYDNIKVTPTRTYR